MPAYAFTDEQKRDMREEYIQGNSLATIGAMYEVDGAPVSGTTIRNVLIDFCDFDSIKRGRGRPKKDRSNTTAKVEANIGNPLSSSLEMILPAKTPVKPRKPNKSLDVSKDEGYTVDELGSLIDLHSRQLSYFTSLLRNKLKS